MHWPRWMEVVAGLPAVAIAAYLMVSTPKSIKRWGLGMVLFSYFLLYYWVFIN